MTLILRRFLPQRSTNPSVVQIRTYNDSLAAIGEKIVAALRQMAVELEQGALLIVDSDCSRIRVLPLQLKN